jgi:hypothetical protein
LPQGWRGRESGHSREVGVREESQMMLEMSLKAEKEEETLPLLFLLPLSSSLLPLPPIGCTQLKVI